MSSDLNKPPNNSQKNCGHSPEIRLRGLDCPMIIASVPSQVFLDTFFDPLDSVLNDF